jgi:ComF family protein
MPTDRFRCLCDERPPQVTAMRAVGPYAGWLRDSILAFKYHDEWSRVEHLAPALIQVLADSEPFDGLVAVPLHPKRLRERGYNQSAVLANAIGKHFDRPCMRAVDRVRATPQQVRLAAAERKANVAGAFASRPDVSIVGYRLVLVDDVVTTGSTLGECATVLRAAGARDVRAVTLARELTSSSGSRST